MKTTTCKKPVSSGPAAQQKSRFFGLVCVDSHCASEKAIKTIWDFIFQRRAQRYIPRRKVFLSMGKTCGWLWREVNAWTQKFTLGNQTDQEPYLMLDSVWNQQRRHSNVKQWNHRLRDMIHGYGSVQLDTTLISHALICWGFCTYTRRTCFTAALSIMYCLTSSAAVSKIHDENWHTFSFIKHELSSQIEFLWNCKAQSRKLCQKSLHQTAGFFSLQSHF